MSLSRWKMMAGVLGVSLGGLAAMAGQCPREQADQGQPPANGNPGGERPRIRTDDPPPAPTPESPKPVSVPAVLPVIPASGTVPVPPPPTDPLIPATPIVPSNLPVKPPIGGGAEKPARLMRSRRSHHQQSAPGLPLLRRCTISLRICRTQSPTRSASPPLVLHRHSVPLLQPRNTASCSASARASRVFEVKHRRRPGAEGRLREGGHQVAGEGPRASSVKAGGKVRFAGLRRGGHLRRAERSWPAPARSP